MIQGVHPQETVDVSVETGSVENETHRVYTGGFTWIRRREGDKARMFAEQSRLLGGVAPVGDDATAWSLMVSELRIVTVESPDWFDLKNLAWDDDQLLAKVYMRYQEWRDSFRRRDQAGASEGSSDTRTG